MCTSKAEGGRRCYAHATESLTKAHDRLQALKKAADLADESGDPTAIEIAHAAVSQAAVEVADRTVEVCATPKGAKDFAARRDRALADGHERKAAVLSKFIERGQVLRERTRRTPVEAEPHSPHRFAGSMTAIMWGIPRQETDEVQAMYVEVGRRVNYPAPSREEYENYLRGRREWAGRLFEARVYRAQREAANALVDKALADPATPDGPVWYGMRRSDSAIAAARSVIGRDSLDNEMRRYRRNALTSGMQITGAQKPLVERMERERINIRNHQIALALHSEGHGPDVGGYPLDGRNELEAAQRAATRAGVHAAIVKALKGGLIRVEELTVVD